jgi:hypothetical protein
MIAGERNNRLVALRFIERVKRQSLWAFICDCGTETIKNSAAVRFGNTKSCGCLQIEARLVSSLKHGHSKGGRRSPEHRLWLNMKQRCSNPKNGDYANYGGRGIIVCSEWMNDFNAFFEHIGPRPSPSHSIDRIRTDGNYEPANVRWATAKTQSRNRRGRRMIECDGEMLCLAEACERKGISYGKVRKRLRRGASDREALSV